ncbi:Endonuclease/exonuclease/phosphatase family protein [Acanthamoeba castellanii str. Neff]|uniref:Endonuclease/exonuclease/phosphatase family protein n=1 Tax=Acanthamoeba castellanii (strain ATCC 30010 / Neff) TaxID=1257118 RepID=L8HHE6_ACACF|nr:Endonuclease/exonuclease/phosphatase family protein [Acanthamoeba castellanii str. Neff]ELR23886.1 Endonuclease/exonuclease/phosphatase family protein [Acanthamoeba castellanii str. Neff]
MEEESRVHWYGWGVAMGLELGVDNWWLVHEAELRREQEAQVPFTKLTAVLMPPAELWPPLLAIKARHMAPHVRRPPYPHFTVASPFIDAGEFDDAELKLRRELQHLPPVEVRLRRFEFMAGQKKALTLILRVFEGVVRALPKCGAQAPFVPHLTVGHFVDKEEAERMRTQYQSEWTELRFTVGEVHLMARSTDGPFESRKAITLAGSP